MPLTARELYTAAQLSPDFFGSAIDFVGTTEAEQQAQAIAYVETQVLAMANSEVAVPVREALNDFTSPLNDEDIKAKFGSMADEIIQLWNAAQTSYGRSELNKRINSDNEENDKDSDQDRIQGNDRVRKLVALVQKWRISQNDGDNVDDDVAPIRSRSRSIRPALFG